MTLDELIHLTHMKLGEQGAFYPPAEIVRGGLNPAQRLLCLHYPLLLPFRVVVTAQVEQPFLDLREVTDAAGVRMGPRIRRVDRVTLGTITDESATPSAGTNERTDLRRTSVQRLSWQRDWLRERGMVRQWFLWGRLWLGLVRRPVAETTLTLMGTAIPRPLVLEEVDSEPEVVRAYHPVIAEIATGLLLVKEGDPAAQLGQQRITHALQLQQQGTAA
jgi:hypothetical protein